MEKFKWMWRDEVMSEVEFDLNTGYVKVVNYTDDMLKRAFGVEEKPTIKDLDEFMEDRSVPENRKNIREILEYMGISKYDPHKITRITNGMMLHDHHWIMYEGNEHLTFKDIRPDLYKWGWTDK